MLYVNVHDFNLLCFAHTEVKLELKRDFCLNDLLQRFSAMITESAITSHIYIYIIKKRVLQNLS